MGQQMGIYISFLKSDGSWTEAQSITETAKINPGGVSGFVSYDGKYLFYLAWRNTSFAVYWIDAGFILDLREKILNG